MAKKKVTIKDIAEYVGVTPMTVSYVLNKNPKQKISEATTKKVLEAVEKLHYVPNNAAKALRAQKTWCIGMAMERSLLTSRYSQVIDGVRDITADRGYTLLLCGSARQKNNLPEYLSYYFENKVDGIIFVGRDGIKIENQFLEVIKKNNIPFVTLDCEGVQGQVATVDYDYYEGARQETEYLIRNGARNIIYLQPDSLTYQEQERLRGVKVVVEKENVPLVTYTLTDVNPDNYGSGDIFINYVKNFSEQIKMICQKEKNNLAAGAVLCSWGDWVEIVHAIMIKENIVCQLGGLAAGASYTRIWNQISYSILPNYKAGNVCAKMIIELIEGSSEIRKEMLKPILSETIGRNV